MPVANFVPSLPDELLFSWICRMADANAVSLRKFSACFLSHSGPEHSQSWPRYDSCGRLEGLLTEFSQFPALSSEKDAISFFLDHSIYGVLSPFLPGSERQRLMSFTFGRSPERRGHHGLIKGRMLEACPECRQEHGIRYFRIHQLPGVTVCPRHGCRLLEYGDRVGNEFLEDATFSEVAAILPTENLEVRYAQFYASFGGATVSCSYEDTEAAIHKKIKEAVRRPSSSPYFDLWLENKYGYIKKDFHLKMPQIIYSDNPDRRKIPRRDLMMLVFLLFESPEEFQSYVPSDWDLMKTVISIIR